jgi:hypothetical protein
MGFPFQEKKAYSELEVQYAWNSLGAGTFLTCTNGLEVEVLYPGRWNFESGPDFLNAKLKISGVELSGDVEIHNTPSDWFLHGHDNDSKYNNVILHVVRIYSCSNVTSSKSPSILTVIFPDSYLATFNCHRKNIRIKKYLRGLCADEAVRLLKPAQLTTFLCNLGENRLNKKTIIFINEILANGAEQTFLIHLFESAGYKNNRQAFMNLYKRFSMYDIFDPRDIKFEAVIWGESGLLPSKDFLKCDNQMQHYISSLWSYWWKLKKDMINLPEAAWVKSAGRLCNTPWRRTAGLIVLFRKVGFSPLTHLLTMINQNMNIKEIIDELINVFSCEDEMLGMYASFNTKLKTTALLIGRSRAIEIIGNLVIPFIYAYSKINKNNILEKRILKIWRELPSSKSNNIAFRISFERWGVRKSEIKEIVKSFSAEQGILFIYKNLCEYLQMNCKECQVYSSFKEYYSQPSHRNSNKIKT